MTSSRIGWIDTHTRRLGIVHRTLREVQVVRPGPIVKSPEISLFSISVLSYGQYSLHSWRLSSNLVSDLNYDPLSRQPFTLTYSHSYGLQAEIGCEGY